MSKIGKVPIKLDGAIVNLNGRVINIKGSLSSGEYRIPECFDVFVDDSSIKIAPKPSVADSSDIRRIWGMHRALLNNKIIGATRYFEKKIKIPRIRIVIINILPIKFDK